MSIWDGNTKYYSGQGTMLIGKRSATGTPAGLIPVGNCSLVKIANAESLIEHKESQTGNRSIDLVLTTQLKPSMSIDMEKIDSKNLALALWGTRTDVLGASVTGEQSLGYAGKVGTFSKVQVSSVVLSRSTQALTLFTAVGTPWDYKLNAANGSYLLNDGKVDLVDKLTNSATGVADTSITGVTVSAGAGQDTTIAVAGGVPAQVVVGDYVTVNGFTGANANLLNGQAWEITSINTGRTSITVRADTSGKTITVTGSAAAFWDGTTLSANFSYPNQKLVDALNTQAPERWVRFEGLNTADSGQPVTIDVFRMRVSPLKELSVLSDDVYKYTLDGDCLLDVLQTTGSQYYRVRMIQGISGTINQ